jgi:WD40 repeat protein
VSVHDAPLALLGGVESSVDPRPEFGAALLERLVGELRQPQRRVVPVRALLLAATLLLVLAAVATATYLVGRTATGSPLDVPDGTLTLIHQNSNGVAKIVAVLPGGRSRVVWQCPGHVRFCGDLTSVDWSSDGKRVAFTIDEIGGRSAYVGLHILDLRTGRDLHIPSLPLAHPLAPVQPESVLRRSAKQLFARLGCVPADVAWSPDGRRLAYGCRNDFQPWAPARIYTIGRSGTGRRLLRTGTRTAFAPSWSPDGTRIAFATWRVPSERVQWDTAIPAKPVRSSVYTVRLDGSGRRLVARDAASPDWSPDGTAIAYDSSGGIKLVSPSGDDLTPHDGGIVQGIPAFSPDGSKLAVVTTSVTVVVEANDWTQIRTLAPSSGTLFGLARPAWYPGTALPHVRKTQQAAPHCRTCL